MLDDIYIYQFGVAVQDFSLLLQELAHKNPKTFILQTNQGQAASNLRI